MVERIRSLLAQFPEDEVARADSRSGLANNLWLQMAALVIVVLVLIALAAKYIW